VCPLDGYTDERKEEIIRAYQERPSMRGIERIFDVCRQTLSKWLKKKVENQPPLEETLMLVHEDDILELDELWSFVQNKNNQRWLWIALCRRTRQIVAYYIGDRSKKSCKKLWNNIPESYKKCYSFSDFWDAYEKVFPKELHQSVGKETGQTSHVERWNNTLRQRISRYVRKTLSFSKSDFFHGIVTRLFIYNYNLEVSACI
jgi:IS1 family transposase